MTIYAPAKVNLYLRVLGRRPDGCHNIETVFERIALCDKIVLNSLRDNKIKIFCDNPGVPTGKKSLIYRTVDLLRREKRISKGAEVKILKKIPIAAGLGGGSSDAASILKGLNRLWRLSVGLPRLLKLGKSLGADMPFFLKDCSFASGHGKGDEVKKLNWKKKFWHLIISPPVKLLSKDVYKQLSLRGGRKAPDEAISFITNDLENIVLKKAPLVRKLKIALVDIGARYSLVSGSGPSVFSLFEKRKEAVRAKELLIRRFPVARRNGWQLFTVSTL
ncbi:MAG: 4-(cytidine 5'-diphospho)-2-C-methyl-D-erythritol kinase [Candidatus Omnitrophota bacterium]